MVKVLWLVWVLGGVRVRRGSAVTAPSVWWYLLSGFGFRCFGALVLFASNPHRHSQYSKFPFCIARLTTVGFGFEISGSGFRFPSFGIQACNGQSFMVGVGFRGVEGLKKQRGDRAQRMVVPGENWGVAVTEAGS
jgi:hypothetical protein